MILIHIFFIIIASLRYIFELLVYLFSYNSYCVKIIVILLFTLLYYKISVKKYKLSTLRRQKYQAYSRYKINDYNDLDISISILYLYIMLFIIGIFFLRIKNMERYLNINEYINKISSLIQDLSLLDFLLNVLLIIFIIIAYITIFSLLFKLMKFHFLRLYYYFFLSFYSKHTLLMLNWKDYLCFNYHIRNFGLFYLPKKLENYPSLDKFIYIHIEGLQFIIHRILLLIIILYDIVYNNMILTHMFKALPIIFIYEIWCKLSIFLTGLNLEYDKVIAILLYGTVTELENDQECLYLNDVPYEKTVLKFIIMSYARNDSIDRVFISKNPINEGIRDILNYWKYIFRKIYKKLFLY